MEQQYEEKYPTPEEFQAWLEELSSGYREVADSMIADSRKPLHPADMADIMYFVDF